MYYDLEKSRKRDLDCDFLLALEALLHRLAGLLVFKFRRGDFIEQLLPRRLGPITLLESLAGPDCLFLSVSLPSETIKHPPHDTLVTVLFCKFSITVGLSRVLKSPCPSSPLELAPQVQSLPLLSTAAPKHPPISIPRTRVLMWCIFVGMRNSPNVPVPQI